MILMGRRKDPLTKGQLMFSLATTIFLVFYNSLGLSTDQPLIIQVGHQFLLETQNLKRIAVGDPEILEISSIENGSGILLAGKKVGKTDLLIWEGNQHTQINVEVKDFPSSHDIEREENLIFFLKSLGINNPRVSYINNEKIVTGEGSIEALESANSILARMENVLPALKRTRKKKKEIMYDLKFLEISKGSLKGLGISWPESMQFDGNFNTEGENPLLFESSFGILIKHLISDGKAKVLANPVLVCEEGKDSSFLAGGEIPVVIIGDEKRDVIWKKYGIILHLNNGMEENGVISTSLEAEVSTIDHSTGSSDIPGFITRRVKTSFSLDQGQTIALSGLVRNETTKDVNKLPLLGHLPIIGELFKSRNFRNNYTELIITVTPSILSDNISDAMIEGFHDKFNRMDKQMKFKLMD
jgi:pilus assembly protein CpaC